MSIRDFQLNLKRKDSCGDRMMAYRALEKASAQRLAQEAEVMGWDPWPQD